MPQAARGCMQLCSLEALQHKAPTWGFGQEMTFSVIFAISEHGHRFDFPKKHRLSPCAARDFNVHGRIGQVFVSRRSFLAFVHNSSTYIFYPNPTVFSIPFIKNCREAFASRQVGTRLCAFSSSGCAGGWPRTRRRCGFHCFNILIKDPYWKQSVDKSSWVFLGWSFSAALAPKADEQ